MSFTWRERGRERETGRPDRQTGRKLDGRTRKRDFSSLSSAKLKGEASLNLSWTRTDGATSRQIEFFSFSFEHFLVQHERESIINRSQRELMVYLQYRYSRISIFTRFLVTTRIHCKPEINCEKNRQSPTK